MKTKTVLTLIFSVALISAAQGQTKFSRQFWQAPEIISATAVTQTSDGGYLLTGTIGSVTDIFMTKFNSIGDTVWTNRFGSTGSNAPNSIQQTNDGGYIITGRTNGAGGQDILLVKTDSLGNVSWAKTYAGINDDIGNSVRQNSDGGYIIAGFTEAPIDHYLVIRTDATGDTLWTKTFPDNVSNRGYFAEQTSDGGFIVAGRTDSISNARASVFKLSPAGNPVWAKKILGQAFAAYHVKQTLDGGYITAGKDGFENPEVIKLDANGNFVFVKRFINATIDDIAFVRAKELADSTYLILTGGNSYSALLIKLNQVGDTVWTKELIYPVFPYYWTDGLFTNDGGTAAAGSSGTIYKLDSTFSTDCMTPASVSGYPVQSESVSNTVINVGAGGVTVTNAAVTNINYSSRKLFSPCTPNIPTCVVTVDSIAQKNLVVWEENFDTTFIDSYQIYKESAAAGVYNLIGSVPVNQFSTFLDNASNPAVQAERYRVSALWHTYYEPPNTVAGHKTIHLSINLGQPPSINLIWSAYQGFTFSTYNIWRGNGTSAAIIASVPFGTNSYTDLSPPPGDSLYFIEVVNTPCVPTFMQPPHGNSGDEYDRDLAGPYDGTRSNMVNRSALIGIDEITSASNLYLYPNPAENELVINNLQFPVSTVEIVDVLGERCQSSVVSRQLTLAQQLSTNNYQLTIDISQLSPGIYFVKAKGEKGERVAKFVKQ